MTDTTVLFLPAADEGYRWLRVDGAAVTARGDGLPASDAGATVAVVPADAVTLHWAELPDRSPAQSLAAARILAADTSATPLGELHVAVGRESAAERPIGVVAATRMAEWLQALAAGGIDPDAVMPAPMLLPRPDEGFLRADLGGQGVIRGVTSGFADEARLTELVTAGIAPTVLGRGEIETAIAAAVAAPALDLRQGVFARRRRMALDWALIRRLAWLGVAIVTVTLAVGVVRIVRYNVAADAAEAQADTLARSALPRGETVNDADRQLDARLAALRGPGQGFSRTAAAAFAAVRSVPGTEIRAINFDGSGDLRLSIASEGEGQVAALTTRLQQSGFVVRAGVFQGGATGMTGDLTVSPR